VKRTGSCKARRGFKGEAIKRNAPVGATRKKKNQREKEGKTTHNSEVHYRRKRIFCCEVESGGSTLVVSGAVRHPK